MLPASSDGKKKTDKIKINYRVRPTFLLHLTARGVLPTSSDEKKATDS